ncbi:MAG: PilW family protein [Haliea sp.]|jgi:type IV pilus assembly protein PilW|nr:PilW family protein [Haliea sp.]
MKRVHPQAHRRVAGLSLPALLISMALGLLFSAVLVWAYLEARRQFLVADELARLQESGRFATALLRRELSLAGFLGGLPLHTPIALPPVAPGCGVAASWPLAASPALDIQSAYGGGAPQTASGLLLDCLPAAMLQRGSDLLAVRRTSGEATLANGQWAAGIAGVEPGHWYLRVTEHGATAEWWQAGQIAATEQSPGSGVDYWRLQASVFYVRRYSVVPADRIPTLCAAALAPAGMLSQCLVEGVELFHLELGLDENADGAPERYISNPSAAQLQLAVAARITLLLRSLAPVSGYSPQRVYRLGQRQFTPGDDGYARRVFSATVPLRNRHAVGNEWPL